MEVKGMLDHHERATFAAVYRLLAEVLEYEAAAVRPGDRVSYLLGDLTGRVFMGTPVEPPDEVLEAVVHALRNGGADQRQHLAARLRSHAEQLDRSPDETDVPA
jgi:hypothetical protein